jgi:hypothetical protein
MIISLEVKNVHDLIMLDTIVDLWKAKWKAEEAEEEEDDDDAEDEPCGCDDDSCEKSAEEAVAETVNFFVEHQDVWEALSGLVKAMRDAGINGTVSFDRGDESWETHRI